MKRAIRNSQALSGAILALLVCGPMLVPGARAEQPRFYLSTERIFSPEEDDIHIRLEARAVPYVDFRLYRIPDPEKFFRQQADLHRVELPNAPKRVSSTDVLQEIWRASLANSLKLVRGRFSDQARSSGRQAYPEQVEAMQHGSLRRPPPTSVLPLLKGFELVDIWREHIPKDSPEWAYLNVAITPRDSGVYLIEGVYGQEVGYTVVVLSRMVLLTRQSADKFLVFAGDPDLGTPVPDVSVTAYSEGQAIVRGTTDQKGLFSKNIPLTRNVTVFASRGDDFALGDPSYYPANLFQRKVYLTTERPVYRPGQEVFFKGVLRAYQDEKFRVEENINQVEVQVQDPNGQEVFKSSIKVGKSGSFNGRFKLFGDAAMGTYRLLARVENKDYGGEFKVKAYRKPEYKVRVSTPKRAYVSGEEVEASVAANYYFGPPVPNAKVKVSVYRTRFYVPWWVDADYSWYYSDAEYRNTLRETILEKEARLDKEGKFSFKFKTRQDSLDFTYGIEAVVIDPSKNSVSGFGSVRVTRAKFRLALEPEFLLFSPGREARVKLTTSDYGNQPLAAEVQVSVGARLGSEPAKAKVEQLLNKKYSTGPQGSTVISFKPERGGVYTVTASAKDDQGNQVQEKTLLFVTSSGGDIPYAPDDLEIVADQRSYHVGDRARFLILAPHPNAHLLITVEGGRLYRHQVVQARGFSTVFEVPVEEAQSPNFMIRAAMVFDRTLYEKRLDVVVPPREKLLNVSVTSDRQEVRPGDRVTFEVAVTDYRGNPVSDAEVALGIVDEAVYGISPEIAIPISRFFYHRKRNNVRSTCSLDFRFYGYGQDAKDKVAALTIREPVVPGSFKALASQDVRKHFKDTLDFFPALVTDSSGKARATVTAPDNLTAWRSTARVVTSDTRVGQATGSVRVSKPVVLRIAAPAYLVERDRSTLALLVHNYTKQEHTFDIKLQSRGKQVKLTGQAAPVKVIPGGVGVSRFDIQAHLSGTAVLTASAKAAGGSDAVQREIPIRPYGLEQVLLAGGVLDDQNPSSEDVLTVPPSAKPESIKADVSLSTGVAPALLASLEYLTGYPYGCTEQTMSRFLPDLVVARVLKDLNMKNQRLEDKLPEYIAGGLAQLARLQHQDGGWGWWVNDATDPFMTAYVVHGLAMAKRLKWPVNQDMLNKGVNRLKALARSRQLNANQRSYLLYSLALAGVKYESMLTKLSANQDLSEYGKALLAMALFELGKREQAAQLASQFDQVVHTGSQGSWWGRENGPGWERDPVETTAAVLRTLLMLNPGSQNISGAVRWLMSVRQGDRWASTRDTAMAVYALVDYLKKSGGRDYNAKVSLSLNDKPQPPRTFGQQDVLKPSISFLSDTPARIGANKISLQRDGRGALFYNSSVKFFGRQKRIPPRGEKFRVSRKIFSLNKTPVGDEWRFTPSALAGPVKSGDELLVVLELTASQDADYIMVEDPLPAGVQPIERDRGYQIAGLRLQQPRMHREFHDSHAAFFISRLRRGKRTLAYLVRATLPGTYQVMPTRILPMYDPQYAGNSANHQLRVED